MTKKKIVITGGAGFIGHHLVEHIFRKTNWNIVILDKLTYAAGGLSRLRDSEILNSNRVKFFSFDLQHSLTEGIVKEIGNDISYIVHMAAETHVDQSILDPVNVIQNNVMNTVHILEFAKQLPNLEKFFYFSTDEVFGPAPGDKMYKEWDVHNPTNPYSASKSAAENICLAYQNTYSVPVIIVNVMNAIGERQHVEKFVPKIMRYVLENKKLLIHADKNLETIGSRFYIHARNIADGVMFLIKNGCVGEKYNITGEKEMNNLDLALKIAEIMKRQLNYEIIDAETDRKGHDIRYALSGEKMEKMGWKPPVNFDDTLRKVVEWTMERREWLYCWEKDC